MKRLTRDRAGLVAAAITKMIVIAPGKELRQAIKNYLYDEFEDIERQVAAERETGDA